MLDMIVPLQFEHDVSRRTERSIESARLDRTFVSSAANPASSANSEFDA